VTNQFDKEVALLARERAERLRNMGFHADAAQLDNLAGDRDEPFCADHQQMVD
jgi:hypothetical protein